MSDIQETAGHVLHLDGKAGVGDGRFNATLFETNQLPHLLLWMQRHGKTEHETHCAGQTLLVKSDGTYTTKRRQAEKPQEATSEPPVRAFLEGLI